MTGLSKITDKILDEARRDAAAILADADARVKEIAEDYDKRATELTAEANVAAKNKAMELVIRARSEEKALKKNIILGAQSDMVDRAFAIAKKEMAELDDRSRLELLTGMMYSALCEEYRAEKEREATFGKYTLPIYEVMLNQRDRAKLGESLIESFRRRIVGKDMGDIPERVRLSAETVEIEGGLVLRRGKVEINSSIEAIFASLRPRLEGEIAKILFPG